MARGPFEAPDTTQKALKRTNNDIALEQLRKKHKKDLDEKDKVISDLNKQLAAFQHRQNVSPALDPTAALSMGELPKDIPPTSQPLKVTLPLPENHQTQASGSSKGTSQQHADASLVASSSETGKQPVTTQNAYTDPDRTGSSLDDVSEHDLKP